MKIFRIVCRNIPFCLINYFYFIGPEIESDKSYEKLLSHNTFYFTSGILKVVCKHVCSRAHTHTHTRFLKYNTTIKRKGESIKHRWIPTWHLQMYIKVPVIYWMLIRYAPINKGTNTNKGYKCLQYFVAFVVFKEMCYSHGDDIFNKEK